MAEVKLARNEFYVSVLAFVAFSLFQGWVLVDRLLGSFSWFETIMFGTALVGGWILAARYFVANSKLLYRKYQKLKDDQ